MLINWCPPLPFLELLSARPLFSAVVPKMRFVASKTWTAEDKFMVGSRFSCLAGTWMKNDETLFVRPILFCARKYCLVDFDRDPSWLIHPGVSGCSGVPIARFADSVAHIILFVLEHTRIQRATRSCWEYYYVEYIRRHVGSCRLPNALCRPTKTSVAPLLI